MGDAQKEIGMKNLIACLVVSVIGIAEMCMAYDVVITQNPDCDTDAGSMVHVVRAKQLSRIGLHATFTSIKM